MKELSIEEKAKRYDEVIEMANSLLIGDQLEDAWIYRLLPELKESEDEKIRKEIINYCYERLNTTYGALPNIESIKRWLTWLEKQKTTEEALQYLKENHSPSEVSDFQAAMNIAVAKAYNKGYTDGLEKQGEQKSADKVESISKDDDDESIRKDIIAYMRYERKSTEEEIENRFIPWLEKQGEPKPADKVEPKFNVGDWLVCCNYEPEQIIGIRNDMYEMSNGDIRPIKMINNNHNIRLWDIQDAKDGDVLAAKINKEPNDFIYIFKEHDQNGFSSYCYLDAYINKFHEGMYHNTHNVGVPATKEQRDLLFQKMKEASYEWDAEKKELKKIEQKPEIKDDVLSRFAFYQYDDDTIYLSSLFVRESDRGCGYGSKVLKAAEEVAKTFGISKIRLKVERNTWMEEWYKKNGYEYLSSEGKYNWLENRVIDIKPNKIEQKPADKVEPKFNVGDWILIDNPCKIISIDNYGNYLVRYWDFDAIDKLHTLSKEFCESYFHLWTIQDAKDGDVLAWDDSNCIAIFKEIYNNDSFKSYGFIGNITGVFENGAFHDIEDVHPATQEQRDLLFSKMKEAGYEWDAEKKELRKIGPKSAWSEEDERILVSIMEDVMPCGECPDYPTDEEREYFYEGNRKVDWLKSLKERMKGE